MSMLLKGLSPAARAAVSERSFRTGEVVAADAAPYVVVSPYSNQYVVGCPFALTLPLATALVVLIEPALPVTTIGAAFASSSRIVATPSPSAIVAW